MRFLACFLLVGLVNATASAEEPKLPSIPRRVPPVGIKLSDARHKELTSNVNRVWSRLRKFAGRPHYEDVAILVKAADYAVRFRELYNEKDSSLVNETLARAEKRIDSLSNGKAPWARSSGRTVLGYRSSIDGSVQPYGLEIPEGFDFNQPAPLYVWLHGRGDKITDLHFLRRRARAGRIKPANAIVVHPFGRHCMGFKSAGEIDVLEAVEAVKQRYKIDENRVVLMGFSMGGAGVWHIGAHYPDRWVAMSPGAGFAETARYNRLNKDAYPPSYEQKLWGLYDVPGYVRNLFNLPTVVYSGEKDKQIQAARVMEEAYLAEGRKLPHIIGPGMGHQYHPDSLKEIMRRMDDAARRGLDRQPKSVHLQTRTLRYNRVFWVEALRLGEHWRDSRIDAEIASSKLVRVTTKNVDALRLTANLKWTDVTIEVDGQKLPPTSSSFPDKATLVRDGQRWARRTLGETPDRLAKKPGLQGPIDDAFMSSFLIVPPSGEARGEAIETWTRFELHHFLHRWQTLYRAQPPVRKAAELTDADIQNHNLVLFGDPNNNPWIRKTLDHARKPPIEWNERHVRVGDRTFDARRHAPILIYRNPLNPAKYVVINSGPTHREGHDRTNSLQNPKLPDWAVIDFSVAPSDTAPGKVVAADFFDEHWRLRNDR